MAIRELTRVFQTQDGKIFATKEDAERHEAAVAMTQAIRQAVADARYSDFGATPSARFTTRLAEELVKAGFVYGALN